MSQEFQINGVDTIQGLDHKQPKEIPLSYTLEKKQQILQQVWNSCYVAIIPYCVSCKVPLVWHTNPNTVLFHCPSCSTEWKKGEGWEKHE